MEDLVYACDEIVNIVSDDLEPIVDTITTFWKNFKEWINGNMEFKELYEKLHSKHGFCCKCGCELEDCTGIGLGNIFILDIDGNFYCTDCDGEFEDGDERIVDGDFFECIPLDLIET